MMRIKVWKSVDMNDRGVGYLGEGELLGPAPMSEVYTEEEFKENQKEYVRGICRELGVPEDGEFFEEKFKNIWSMIQSATYDFVSTLKIRMDSGEIVYRCQVWWEEV